MEPTRADSFPNPAVRRLSLYLRQLESFKLKDRRTISSRQLGESLNLTDAQVRQARAKGVDLDSITDQAASLPKGSVLLSVEDGKSIEEYQFARLCHFLRNTPPLAQPGYTFLVFELTDDEVNRALYSPLRTL